jgi:hypothetical protein
VSETLLRALLTLLAAYHLGIGLLSALRPRTAGRVSATLYGTNVAESPQLRYGLRMLGLYAIAIGSLLVLAAASPAQHRPVILVACALQLARAACRIAFRSELTAAYGISPRRNYLNASLLVAEALVLAVALPAV